MISIDMPSSFKSTDVDIEKRGGIFEQLNNTTVRSFGWQGVTVTVKDRQTKRPKDILQGVNGVVKAGMYLLASELSGSNQSS